MTDHAFTPDDNPHRPDATRCAWCGEARKAHSTCADRKRGTEMTTRHINRAFLTVEGGRDLAVEASAIGLAPGEWPEAVTVADRFGSLCRYEKLTTIRDNDGDVQWVAYTYRERFTSHTLRVYND